MSAKRPPAPSAGWRNRIVGSGDEAPDQLLANPANWRKHPPDQRAALRGSLDAVGWVAQVMVNRTTGHVVDGHARIEEAISRAEPTVPVLYVELSPEDEQLVLATLDPIGALATAEKDALEALLAGLSPSDDALRTLLAELGERNAIHRLVLGDPDEIPAVPDEADVYVKPGDLWLLGEHRLLAGDATKPEDVARLMDGSLADCMWTDPPYGVDYVGKTPKRLTISNDSEEASDDVVAGTFRLAPLAPSARFYIAAPAGPRHVAFHEAVERVGWRLHQELIWLKGSIVLGHSDYHYAHEPILYGFVPGDGRPGRGRHEGTRWYGDNSQSSVLEYPKPAANREHPTAKPVGLVEQCLRNSTQIDDLVYEPFAGSGTTLVAAETLGRRCFAVEIDPKYVQVTIDRWQGLTGQKAERVDARA